MFLPFTDQINCTSDFKNFGTLIMTCTSIASERTTYYLLKIGVDIQVVILYPKMRADFRDQQVLGPVFWTVFPYLLFGLESLSFSK